MIIYRCCKCKAELRRADDGKKEHAISHGYCTICSLLFLEKNGLLTPKEKALLRQIRNKAVVFGKGVR